MNSPLYDVRAHVLGKDGSRMILSLFHSLSECHKLSKKKTGYLGAPQRKKNMYSWTSYLTRQKNRQFSYFKTHNSN